MTHFSSRGRVWINVLPIRHVCDGFDSRTLCARLPNRNGSLRVVSDSRGRISVSLRARTPLKDVPENSWVRATGDDDTQSPTSPCIVRDRPEGTVVQHSLEATPCAIHEAHRTGSASILCFESIHKYNVHFWFYIAARYSEIVAPYI